MKEGTKVIRNVIITILSILAIGILMNLIAREATSQIVIDPNNGYLTAPSVPVSPENPLGLQIGSCYTYDSFHFQRRLVGMEIIYLNDDGYGIYGIFANSNRSEKTGKLWYNFYPSIQVFAPEIKVGTGICVTALLGISSIPALELEKYE